MLVERLRQIRPEPAVVARGIQHDVRERVRELHGDVAPGVRRLVLARAGLVAIVRELDEPRTVAAQDVGRDAGVPRVEDHARESGRLRLGVPRHAVGLRETVEAVGAQRTRPDPTGEQTPDDEAGPDDERCEDEHGHHRGEPAGAHRQDGADDPDEDSAEHQQEHREHGDADDEADGGCRRHPPRRLQLLHVGTSRAAVDGFGQRAGIHVATLPARPRGRTAHAAAAPPSATGARGAPRGIPARSRSRPRGMPPRRRRRS